MKHLMGLAIGLLIATSAPAQEGWYINPATSQAEWRNGPFPPPPPAWCPPGTLPPVLPATNLKPLPPLLIVPPPAPATVFVQPAPMFNLPPNLATKEDLAKLATKEDMAALGQMVNGLAHQIQTNQAKTDARQDKIENNQGVMFGMIKDIKDTQIQQGQTLVVMQNDITFIKNKVVFIEGEVVGLKAEIVHLNSEVKDQRQKLWELAMRRECAPQVQILGQPRCQGHCSTSYCEMPICDCPNYGPGYRRIHGYAYHVRVAPCGQRYRLYRYQDDCF